MGKRVPEHALTAAERKLLSSCLQAARRSIHADYERAPSQFKALFLYIEREIFSPDFTIEAARDAANFRSNSYTTRFYKITGKRPKEYVEHHRIMTAQKIIKHTDVYHWQVGSMVGFSYPSVFSRSYKKIVGYPPNKEPKANVGENSERSYTQQPSPASSVITNALDPRVSATTAEIHTVDSRLKLERFWADVQGKTRLQIKAYILTRVDIIDVHHYHYLLEKAKFESRLNLERGKELCLSALDTLRLVEFKQGKEFLDEKAIGYASLANLCRLEFDFGASRHWFGFADSFMPGDPNEKPLLFAQVNLLRASLLWWRRETHAAIRLLKDIIPVLREHGSYAVLARALLLNGELLDCCGHIDRALPLLSQAVELTPFIDDHYVVFSAHFNLTFCYTRLSMAVEATTQFAEVTRLRKTVEGQISPFYILHLEGSVSRTNQNFRKAERLFLEAREGFLNQGLDIFAALVSLELSLIYLALGEPRKAFLEATSVIPTVSRHSFHQEEIAALNILEEADRQQLIDKAIVQQAMKQLDLVRKDPTANFFR